MLFRATNRLVASAFLGGIAAFAVTAGSDLALAQTCGSDYEIKQGDTLALIATRVYGKPSQWTVIFYANQDRLGANASLLIPGLSIRIPCIGGASREGLPEAATAPAERPAARPQGHFVLSSLIRRIEFLTADGFSPFAGRSLQNGGMLTHAVGAAMDKIKAQANGQFDYGISWVNDRSAHLNPLLATRAFDAGFPWGRPDCENFAELDQDGKYRCQKFFFSDPLYEALTLIFVKKTSPIENAMDEDMRGKTVCRPGGESVYELDSGGKNWVKNNLVVLVQPQTVDECFRLLDSGAADAVAVTDLVGQAVVSELSMGDRVRAIERPIAIGTLHVIVSKTHPQARTILYYVNEALSKLKKEGEFDKIVESHLAVFWDTDSTGAGTVSAPAPSDGAAPLPVKGPSGEKDSATPKGPSELANGQSNTAPRGK